MAKPRNLKRIPALSVPQWLHEWDSVEFDKIKKRAKPEPQFYIFSLPANELRSLCGIFRRQAKGVTPRATDLGIQRQHDPDRSTEIARFVRYGYPWSTLSSTKRQNKSYNDLRKPGWLPTSIVINILGTADVREGSRVAADDAVEVHRHNGMAEIELPYSKWTPTWEPSSIAPFEVIDGQHRLWAFEEQEQSVQNFELPIVAFHKLDISWQAYLFWTINIKPKRINQSLAFDLYPLLRAEDWLERAEEHVVYRDTRAQELTEVLWSHPQSPWFDKINMLGERGNRWPTQAGWIRSLTASFIKPWSGRSGRAGGLFGERISDAGEVLAWTRPQQAAFLIFAWLQLRTAIHSTNSDWAKSLRRSSGLASQSRKVDEEPGFYSPASLLTTDQGVRAFLQLANDLCYTSAARLKLNTWAVKAASGPVQEDVVSQVLRSIEKQDFTSFLTSLGKGLATFDWRTSAAEDLTESERQLKLAFRGSGGYKELRRQLLQHLTSLPGEVSKSASKLLEDFD